MAKIGGALVRVVHDGTRWYEDNDVGTQTEAKEGRENTMLRKLLFDTRIGEWLLSLLERMTGLAVVEASWLAEWPTPAPAATGGGD
jgi:hypothetical protein